VIENRPGGGGTLGPAFVAKADPDGYTLLLHSSSLSSQVVLHKVLPCAATVNLGRDAHIVPTD
jgi:tripartite-type tricarboxylate transporter receptor subunit TctC